MALTPKHEKSAPASWWWLVAIIVVALSGCTEAVTPEIDKPQPRDVERCLESEFSCITIEAPLDHDDPDAGTIDVVFAVRSPDGPTQGVLVTAVGGPGGSGIEQADAYLATLDPEITDNFELVFFDQRGVGMFEEPACPEADEKSYNDWAQLPDDPEEQWEAVGDLAADYAESCVAEIGDPEALAYLGTGQAVHDLEMFRRHRGYGRLTIYGESYGTRYAQTYAATYPESVERLVLDGTIDPTRDDVQFQLDQIVAFEAVLQSMFGACDLDDLCAADMGRTASVAYRDLVSRLREEPITVTFPVAPDYWDKIPLLADDILYLAWSAMYAESDRMFFLRALAAAGRGDYTPMMRLLGLDFSQGLSATLNIAVNCLDGSIPGDDSNAEIEAITAARGTVTEEHRWLFGNAPTCVFWPHVDPLQEPPPPFVGAGIATLVVAAEGDVVTPYSHAVAVAERLASGHLLTVRGGSHVMYGRGIVCIDDAVTAFIVEGTFPFTERCDADLIGLYLPLIPESAAGHGAQEMLSHIDDELYAMPELVLWNGYDEMEVSCNHGGGVTFIGDDTRTWFDLDDCGLASWLIVNGDGEWDFEIGSTRLDVAFNECTYVFELRWDTLRSSLEEDCG